MQSGIFITDTHWKGGDPLHPAYKLVKAFAGGFRPHYVVHGGDIGEWEFLHHANKERLGKIHGQTFAREFDIINRELDFWQDVCSELHVLQGNHDDRVNDAIATMPTLDGLANWEIQVAAKHDMKLYTLQDQPVKIGKLHFLHGRFINKYHTYKHLERYTANVCYGHVHEFQKHSKLLWGTGQEIQAWSIGCLTHLAPEWMEGTPTEWQHGFAVFFVGANGNFNLYPINIIDNAFYDLRGNYWDLKQAEKLLKKTA